VLKLNIADPAAAYERLRAETAAMLKLSPDSSSLVEGLQVDLVSLLRLEVDMLQGQVLAGETVDLTRLVAAHGMLQKMLPERALVAPAPAAADHDFAGAKEELRRLLDQRAGAIERREQNRENRETALLAENARLREEVVRLKAQPRPQPANNVVPIDGTARANAARPPDHYLKSGQPREPWERGATFNVPSWPLPQR
jgi:hypothetical protein